MGKHLMGKYILLGDLLSIIYGIYTIFGYIKYFLVTEEILRRKWGTWPKGYLRKQKAFSHFLRVYFPSRYRIRDET